MFVHADVCNQVAAGIHDGDVIGYAKLLSLLLPCGDESTR
jgi:hypothetical protein